MSSWGSWNNSWTFSYSASLQRQSCRVSEWREIKSERSTIAWLQRVIIWEWCWGFEVYEEILFSLRSFYTKALFIKSFLSTIIIVISLEWEVNMLWHSEELENESKKRSSDARESSAKRNEMRKLCREMEKREQTREDKRIFTNFTFFFFFSFFHSSFVTRSWIQDEMEKRWKSFGVCDRAVWERSFLPRNVGCSTPKPPNFSTPLQVS